ncbi:MAG TPA: hypothetical protein VNX68_16910 [Nitrosopumilaceae archaeon]|jgi:hypothetical protein|nr:hypothetical protein [Nitrosopumilaceae archaeon]
MSSLASFLFPIFILFCLLISAIFALVTANRRIRSAERRQQQYKTMLTEVTNKWENTINCYNNTLDQLQATTASLRQSNQMVEKLLEEKWNVWGVKSIQESIRPTPSPTAELYKGSTPPENSPHNPIFLISTKPPQK